MSITVGLDFGTHQTKICVEDASNPAQKRYEFFEFENSRGGKSVLLPSIVQINTDNTVSYGFVDEGRCKVVEAEESSKPVFEQPIKPELVLKEKPVKKPYPNKPQRKSKKLDWKDKLAALNKGKSINNPKTEDEEFLRWERKCKEIDDNYNADLRTWENEAKQFRSDYQKKLATYEREHTRLKTKYEREFGNWEKSRVKKLRYRYFKLASFSNTMKWEHQIPSDTISVWYLAFIIFHLNEKYGEEIFIQVGVPSGMNKRILDSQSRKAYTILIAAYKLVELYGSKNNFLSEDYLNLLEYTEIQGTYSDDDLYTYGLNALPEAYAGLTSITQRGRIAQGINMLIDIGGGTTDVAIFTIINGQPDIHAVDSFPKGLNFIFEEFASNNHGKDIDQIQNEFLKNGADTRFQSSIAVYHNDLTDSIFRMVTRLRDSFKSAESIHRLPLERLDQALQHRPIIFCGGGSVFRKMRKAVRGFNDIKLVDRALLDVPILVNRTLESSHFTILANSFGLSIPLEDEIRITPLENVFHHLVQSEGNTAGNDYIHGLSDT